MTRFLIIVSSYPPRQKAGMELSIMRFSEALARRGHPVTVLTQFCEGRPPICEESGVRVYRTLKPWNLGPLWGFTYIQQTGKWMMKLKDQWDVCVCRGISLHCSPARMITRRLGRPMVNIPASSGPFGDIAETRSSRFGASALSRALEADGQFALSRAIADELTSVGVPRDRIYEFRNLVDFETFSPAQFHQKNLFLFAGRFDEQKNIPFLIRAFERVASRSPAARLLLVGAGRKDKEIRELCAQSAAKAAITIQPWSDSPAKLFRDARAFVLPSRGEGLSNALLESLACGTPCIATDVSGAREALGVDADVTGVAVGKGGIVVAPDDEQALAQAMELLLKDDALRNRLSSSGLEYVRSRHNEEECVSLFLRGCEAIRK